MFQRHPKTFVAVLLAVLILYVPLYGLYRFGTRTVFGYFAHDAFYYLTVAKNSSFLFFTFDGEKATNGFHPLWQYVLTAVFAGIDRHDSVTQLYAAYVLGALLVAIGYVLMGWSLYMVTRSRYWPMSLIPGPFYLLFTVRMPHEVAQGVTYTYSPWAFMNGMESPCSIAAGGLYLYMLTRLCHAETEPAPLTSPGAGRQRSLDYRLLVLGCSLALIVLARLDDVFLVITTALYFLAIDWRCPKPLTRALLTLLPSVLVVSAYLAFNYISCESLLPVSGRIKSTTGAALTGNLAMSFSDLFPPLHEIIRPSYRLEEWCNTAARSSAMILPILFCLWLGVRLIKSRIRQSDSWRGLEWLLPMVMYIVLKGSYNVINVRLGSQGYWYYALTIVLTNYLVMVTMWRMVPWGAIKIPLSLRRMCIGLYICFYLFTAAHTISLGSVVDERFYPLWRDRKEVTSALKKIDPHIRLIDRSDGTYAYSLDMPAVCALGYAIDKQGYEALQNNAFLDYCLSRGFNATFLGKNAYPIPGAHGVFERLYEHHASGTVFVKIVPTAAKEGTDPSLSQGSHKHE